MKQTNKQKQHTNCTEKQQAFWKKKIPFFKAETCKDVALSNDVESNIAPKWPYSGTYLVDAVLCLI